MGDNYLLFWIVMLAIGFVIWGVVSIFRKANEKDEKDVFIDDMPPQVVEEYATIIDKTAGIRQTGPANDPGHSVDFLVAFRYDTGKEITLYIPQETYDKLSVGMRDKLITQNNNFIDFGGIVGSDSSENTKKEKQNYGHGLYSTYEYEYNREPYVIKIAEATDADILKTMEIRLMMVRNLGGLPEDTVFEEAFTNSTEEYFKGGTQTTLLATDIDNNEVVGCGTICYIKVLPTRDHPSGNRAHIMNVYTKEEYRGHGIAYEIMKLLIEEAKQNDVSEIYLDATDLGRPLYEKCGFVNATSGMVLNIK